MLVSIQGSHTHPSRRQSLSSLLTPQGNLSLASWTPKPHPTPPPAHPFLLGTVGNCSPGHTFARTAMSPRLLLISKDLFASLSTVFFHASLLEPSTISIPAISPSRYPLAIPGKHQCTSKTLFLPQTLCFILSLTQGSLMETWGLPLPKPCSDYPWLPFSIPSMSIQPRCPPSPTQGAA